jgi:hypothetical protein
MDQKTIELIHGDVDGELGPNEQEELRRLLAFSQDARREHARLHSLNELLAALPACEPPAGMRDAILAAVPRPARPMATPVRARRRSRAGLVAALAATAAGVVFLLQRDHQVPELDPASLAGTFARPAAGTDVPGWRLVDPAVSGGLSLRQGEHGLYIEVDLEAQGQITLVARIGGRPLEFEGLVPIDGAPESATRTGPGIRMLHSGKHRYAILLRDAAGPGEIVELAVYEGERLVGETRLAVGRESTPAGD